MQRIIDPSSIGLIVLSVAFVARTPHAIRVPAARATWVASGVGALALLSCGTLIPIEVLDGVLGGTNLISLVQNVSAAIALWLVMQAVVTHGRVPLHRLFQWPLLVGVGAFTVAFFFVDRGATVHDFMFDRADQLPTFIYSAIYLALIGGICSYLFMKVWENESRSFAALLIGAAAVAVSSVVQLVALASILFSVLPQAATVHVYEAGLVLLSGGVAIMAANMAGIALIRVRTSRRLARSIESVESIMRSNGVPVPSRPAPQGAADSSNLSHLYEDVIIINDHIRTHETALSSKELQEVSRASHLVTRKTFNRRPFAERRFNFHNGRPGRMPWYAAAVLNWGAKASPADRDAAGA